MSSLFYLCQEHGCKRKYKTGQKLIDHMLEQHMKIIDKTTLGAQVEVTKETKEYVDKNKDKEILRKQAMEKAEEAEKIRIKIAEENADRLRKLEEKKLEVQEAQVELDKKWTTVVKKIVEHTDGATCAICSDAPPSGAITPCGHANFCFECITQYHRDFPYKPCPFCGKTIISVMKIYTN
jgi:Zinc finger, C3HC4 type (RING finger)